MRILILNTDYPEFLRSLYANSRGLAQVSYAEQMAARNATLVGVADFYSRNLRGHGHVAEEIHVNNPWPQSAWARETGRVAAFLPAQTALSPRMIWRQRAIEVIKPIVRPI